MAGKGGKISPATEFKPGQTGNPNGRPKKLPELDKLLAGVLGDEQNGMTAGEAILMRLRKDALSGHIRAAEILLDRAYGKPKQPVEHSGDQDKPIKVQTDKLSLDELKVLTKLREKKI